MNRRDFCKHLALLAAGAAALPQQIAAFERVFDINTRPLGERDLISVEDIAFGFLNPGDAAFLVQFLCADRVLYQVPINKRATFRTLPNPQCPMLATLSDFRWVVTEGSQQYPGAHDFIGSVRLTDQDGRIHTAPIEGASGRLSLALSHRGSNGDSMTS